MLISHLHPSKKAQKRLYFLRKLARFPCQVLLNFYGGAIESILTGNITNWHGMHMAQDSRALQQVFITAQSIFGTHLPSILDIGEMRCPRSVRRIPKDDAHPSHRLFTLLPSGKRYRSICCCTTSCFFPHLWNSTTQPLHLIIINSSLFCFCLCVA